MHGAFSLNPGSGSLEIRSKKLEMNVGFMSDALARADKSSSRRGVVHFSEPIRASAGQTEAIKVSPGDAAKAEEQQNEYLQGIQQLDSLPEGMWSKPIVRRKTKIVCTIGPSTNTREMIWKLRLK